jgi:hypothetical protein
MAVDFTNEELIRELGKTLTAEIAPAESPFYDELVDAYSRPQTARKDRTLGFGVSPADGVLAIALFEIGKVVLQAVWVAAQPMLTGIVQDTANELHANLSEKIKQWIKSRFNTPAPVTLKPDAIQRILEAVQKTGSQQGLDEAQVAQVTQTISRAISGPKA